MSDEFVRSEELEVLGPNCAGKSTVSRIHARP